MYIDDRSRHSAPDGCSDCFTDHMMYLTKDKKQGLLRKRNVVFLHPVVICADVWNINKAWIYLQ